MNDKSMPIMYAQREAFDAITRKGSEFYCNPLAVTTPAVLVQEQAYVNTTSSFTFDFSQNAPQATATLNNVQLKQNNIFFIYGMALWQGTGANANTRTYKTFGSTANDDAIYNSVVSMSFEVNAFVNFMPGQMFREVGQTNTEFDYEMGMVLINPQRILTGRLGIFSVNIALLNSISGVALTANTFLSLRLYGVMGQAGVASGKGGNTNQ